MGPCSFGKYFSHRPSKITSKNSDFDIIADKFLTNLNGLCEESHKSASDIKQQLIPFSQTKCSQIKLYDGTFGEISTRPEGWASKTSKRNIKQSALHKEFIYLAYMLGKNGEKLSPSNIQKLQGQLGTKEVPDSFQKANPFFVPNSLNMPVFKRTEIFLQSMIKGKMS